MDTLLLNVKDEVVWNEDDKKKLIEAMDVLPEDIREGLIKTISRQAEKYRKVDAIAPKLRLVVNGVRG